jgi:hypothetical protein
MDDTGPRAVGGEQEEAPLLVRTWRHPDPHRYQWSQRCRRPFTTRRGEGAPDAINNYAYRAGIVGAKI